MSRIQPVFAVLRPLRAPRTPAFRCFSAAPALRVDAPATPNTPKASARAADLAEAEAATEADSAQAAAPKPVLPSTHTKAAPSRPSKKTAAGPLVPELNLPPPKYLVGRSANKNWPIYTDFKRGGNLHITTIRKITGDLTALRDELRVFLNKKNNEVHINDLTKQVIVKGHHVPQITAFLKARGM